MDRMDLQRIYKKISSENVIQEAVISEYILNNYFLKKDKVWGTFSYLITNTEEQMNGKDIVFLHGKREVNFDIKVQNGASEKAQNRLELEVSYLNDFYGMLPGWFLRDNDTEYYGFVWVLSADKNEYGRITKIENIRSIQVCFVKKETLKEYVAKNISLEDLNNKIFELRAEEKNFVKITDKMYLRSDFKKYEQPVDIVIPKDEILKLGTQTIII